MVALISPTASSASLVTTTRLVSSTLRSIAITSSGVEAMYTNGHAAIRADPAAKEKSQKEVKTKRWNRAKMSKAQREDRVKQRKTAFLKKLQEDE